jgi:hypothetical protein
VFAGRQPRGGGTRYHCERGAGHFYPAHSKPVTRDDWLFWISIAWVIGFAAVMVWLFLADVFALLGAALMLEVYAFESR